ncbi:hypothetical protein CIB95_09255 [Lottiidibacillus patelloidae]|uniref:Peptidase M28 domain-containing protein n=1 Tax=Lottiidibacillus patelloidae TaxID=2670334 RepID=A0A263BUE6_9BACI|nr:M20/M25/M40 family metallo-hydrolase [Lottiidibacillus patelloidae]OZM56947.1 hypothetical protein CIB95_09255 [Lottiidibacillus patelloidae]
MKTWNELFIRHGWLITEAKENQFSLEGETAENIKYLTSSLEKARVDHFLISGHLFIYQAPISEEKWIDILDFERRGRTENIWEQADISQLDTYIAGIVRQLNSLGFETTSSCDGHSIRSAKAVVKKTKNIEQLITLVTAINDGSITLRESERCYTINFRCSLPQLLNYAEELSLIDCSTLNEDSEAIKKGHFNTLLEELLSINGESRNESKIRSFIRDYLTPFVDHITEDQYGNLLAEKTFRNGNGPTILLNAHLDTFEAFASERTIVKDGPIWSSSNGILGADDRAGIAILLTVAKFLPQTHFNGKVKFVFTVEEEIGLLGARNVNDYFLWGVDAALVVDRRGKGDIVTSCYGAFPFCDKAYSDFIEKVASDSGMPYWKATSGGSSDTKIWAEHNIQSVNLSAGYMNEHTDDETLDIEASYEVTKLVEAIFLKSNELRATLREINNMKRNINRSPLFRKLIT